MKAVGEGRAFVGLSPTNYRTLTGELDAERRAVWPGDVEFIEWPSGATRAGTLARLVRTAKRYQAIVVDGSVGLRAGYGDLLAAALLGRLGPGGPIVLVADATWKRGVSVLDRAALRLGIRLVDAPNVRFCVLSRDEVEIFPRTWGVDRGKVFFTPWPHTLTAAELDTARTGGVFAGGDSLRDYRPLVEAARDLAVDVTIASRNPDAIGVADLPPNVHAGAMPHDEYLDALRRASIVVVPMQPTVERGAGQTTYCNALAMGKLVIVTDTIAIRDYIENHETGLIVPPGDPAALREALAWAIDPANEAEVNRVVEQGRAMALDRLAPDRYVINLLRIARTALEGRV